MTDKRIFWLWLNLVFGPANPRIWQLSKHYDKAETFVNALLNGSVRELTENEAKRVKKVPLNHAKEMLDYCNSQSINVYCYESEGYPEKLRRISNPPATLFCYGSLDFLNDKVCIAVVGTRNPSDYSVETTSKLCNSLVGQSFILASGFANGIDRIANSVSLENDMPTIAVCGTPLESDYPKGSAEIKQHIAQNGVVISEFYPGCKQMGNAFVNRNRILVGLSDGVLFCECSADSHGLDNAKHAITQGKPIFVIPPHDIFDERYFGQRNLMRNGAAPVFDGWDIAYNLAYERFEDMSIRKSLGEYSIPVNDSNVFSHKPDSVNKKAKSKHNKKKNIGEEKIQGKIILDYSKLTPVQQKICKVLENENLLADEIAAQTEENISDILSALIELELEGTVTALAGKMYGLN